MPFARSDGLSRRALLGTLLASSALLLPGCDGAASEPGESKTLAAIARALFPFSFLPDVRYQAVIDGLLTTDPRPDPAAVGAAIEAAAPGGRVNSGKIPALLAQPFGQQLRFATLVGLFADPAVYVRFGYQGPSLEQGGYFERGFNDLAWLPEPTNG